MKVKILAKSLKKTIKQIKSDRNAHQNVGAFFIANTANTRMTRFQDIHVRHQP